MIFQIIENKDEFPLLTEVVNDMASDSLPMLTEVVSSADSSGKSQRTLGGDEMVQLLQRTEVHLETVFAAKLNNQLEQLQRLAVDLAISEFKAELPQLLHEALVELKKSDADRKL